jgi:hypothetical protein
MQIGLAGVSNYEWTEMRSIELSGLEPSALIPDIDDQRLR